MRYLLLMIVLVTGIVSCNKDKYSTVPQIKFKSITSSFVTNGVTPPSEGPIVTITVTDADGDFGIVDNKDTSWIFIKNLTVAPFKVDSFLFPKAVTNIVKKNFNASVDVLLGGDGSPGRGVLTSSALHHTDTTYFEIYVKDLGKNKSNVIKTDDPLLYINP